MQVPMSGKNRRIRKFFVAILAPVRLGPSVRVHVFISVRFCSIHLRAKIASVRGWEMCFAMLAYAVRVLKSLVTVLTLEGFDTGVFVHVD